METSIAILVFFALLQVKHLFADFYFQTATMLEGRENYFHKGRCIHATIHILCTIPVLLLMGTTASGIILLCVLEWIIHFHIDWAKARYTLDRQLTPQDAGFWHAMGADQALHHFTYIGMIWLWLNL